MKASELAALDCTRGGRSTAVRSRKLDLVPVTQLYEGGYRSFAKPTSQLREESPYFIVRQVSVGRRKRNSDMYADILILTFHPFSLSPPRQ